MSEVVSNNFLILENIQVKSALSWDLRTNWKELVSTNLSTGEWNLEFTQIIFGRSTQVENFLD